MDSIDLTYASLPLTVITITGVLSLAAFLLYKWLLPKPIHGIPCNKEATRSLFGDIPSMLNHLKTHKTFSDWFLSHNTRHKSPIVQIFPNPFGKPVVMISDYRESQDILMRRTKEFDKPDLISDIFFGLSSEQHMVLPTNDAFRAQRKLLQDRSEAHVMAPGFLNGVAAPQLHASFMDLISLWREKMRLSEGRPFSVKVDINDAALEAIWASIFGIEETATITREQVTLLSSKKNIELPPSVDLEVGFPRASAPPEFDAILRLTDTIEIVIKSPAPRLVGRLLRWVPRISKLLKLRDEMISAQISKAEKRMAHTKGTADKISNAVDHVLRRELMAAERQNRAPHYQSKVIIAELFGLLVAGHDTTSTALSWALKLLAGSQDIQRKLRSELRSSFAAAHSQNRVPDAHEIATTQNHYLDACLEEILRCAQTATIPSRTATTDAVILGHVIPKGTRVMMCGLGGGLMVPPFEIDDALRSKSYHVAGGGKVGEWGSGDMTEFKPDRWLVKDSATDSQVFDAMAGPHLQFGAGPRSCFGRKLAYLELRLAIVLVIWSFELKPVPERYASWEAVEGLTHAPVQSYVRLVEA
ncbi:cytochrome P450 [Cucurbitaria berberidis CBS 394.84]|uniref:Cytochrome P450 n=1 Tax=Cucurbitaria berberidis CBS 394.84 TaxID=1168544 RepID=A0A9P4GI83_9PLEO|nr:cytochrome P450 [Cucurbitaria berberidis CBS 394.84]KAF1845896.1 cytochrome P450 [Cucurbitaria berberidis CBS 394.84]